ncbi:hypothetical protein [Sharpea azabuensis]|nr:hypothetical protein [Sharpea azabuensis]
MYKRHHSNQAASDQEEKIQEKQNQEEKTQFTVPDEMESDDSSS